jgi:hypothetical protein
LIVSSVACSSVHGYDMYCIWGVSWGPVVRTGRPSTDRGIISDIRASETLARRKKQPPQSQSVLESGAALNPYEMVLCCPQSLVESSTNRQLKHKNSGSSFRLSCQANTVTNQKMRKYGKEMSKKMSQKMSRKMSKKISRKMSKEWQKCKFRHRESNLRDVRKMSQVNSSCRTYPGLAGAFQSELLDESGKS